MRTVLALVLPILLVLAAAPRPAEACEPCPPDYTLDLAESVAAADLVAIARRIGPPAPTEPQPDGPPTLEIEVSTVLEGELPDGERILTVHSWSGMCPYGLVIDPSDTREHVVVLRRVVGGKPEQGDWDVARSGCSVGSLPIVDDHVVIDGEKVHRDELAEALGL